MQSHESLKAEIFLQGSRGMCQKVKSEKPQVWEAPTHCCWLWDVGSPMEGAETSLYELEWADGQQSNRHLSLQ